jgi:hypothetical protein
MVVGDVVEKSAEWTGLHPLKREDGTESVHPLMDYSPCPSRTSRAGPYDSMPRTKAQREILKFEIPGAINPRCHRTDPVIGYPLPSRRDMPQT